MVEQTSVDPVSYHISQSLLAGVEQKSQEQSIPQRVIPNTDAANPMQVDELLEGLSQVKETRIQTELDRITQQVQRRVSSQVLQTVRAVVGGS